MEIVLKVCIGTVSITTCSFLLLSTATGHGSLQTWECKKVRKRRRDFSSKMSIINRWNSNSLTKKRLRNKNFILRSKLRSDIATNENDSDDDDEDLHEIELRAVKMNKYGTSLAEWDYPAKPLPMKLRDLPQSFWEQPNRMPNYMFSESDCRKTLPDAECDENHNKKSNEQDINISDANTDLLFSLFRTIEEDGHSNSMTNGVLLEENNNNIASFIKIAKHDEENDKRKRFRSKTRRTSSSSYARKKIIRDDDPYLANNITENLLPFLPVRMNKKMNGCREEQKQKKSQPNHQRQQQRRQVYLRRVSASSEPLCGCHSPRNYSQILSQLVVQL